MGRVCGWRDERPDFSISVPFCTISSHFEASAAGEGGLEDSGLERREERPDIPISVPFRTISSHFGAPAAGEGGLEDSGREQRMVTTCHGPQWLVLIGSVDGLDLTCIYDMGNLWGWARGKCQWFGALREPQARLTANEGRDSRFHGNDESGRRGGE